MDDIQGRLEETAQDLGLAYIRIAELEHELEEETRQQGVRGDQHHQELMHREATIERWRDRAIKAEKELDQIKGQHVSEALMESLRDIIKTPEDAADRLASYINDFIVKVELQRDEALLALEAERKAADKWRIEAERSS